HHVALFYGRQPRVGAFRAAYFVAFFPAGAVVERDDVGGEVERARAFEERAADGVGVGGDAVLLERADTVGVEAAAHDDLHPAEAFAVERVAHVVHELRGDTRGR